MRLPDVIGRQLGMIERRHSGPIPAEEHFLAMLPERHTRYARAEVDDALAYCRWLCANEWKKVKASAYWVTAGKGRPGLTATTDCERFGIAARRLMLVRRLRDAWARRMPLDDRLVASDRS